MKSDQTWQSARIGDILKIRNGYAVKSSDYSHKGVPLIRQSDINGETIDISAAKRVPTRVMEECGEYLVRKGDLLIGMSGSLGKIGRYVNEEVAIQNQRTGLLQLKPGFTAGFAKLVLKLVEPQIIAEGKGVAVQNVSAKEIEDCTFPLPPGGERERIVAEIEKEFTRLDAGLTSLNRVQTALRRYRASVLKAACEGRLVPTEAELARKENRPYETGEALLARTPIPPRPNRWKTKSKDVILGHSALAVGNPELALPEGWTWAPLVAVARMESGHTPSREHPEWWNGNIPWIGIADAREHDGRIIDDTFQHTNEEGLKNSAARLLPAGTVCVSRTASVGYVVTMGRPMATSQDFVNWIPAEAVTSKWLALLFGADREALRRFGKGSVHKTIYFPEWLAVHVGLPPLIEQHRIVAEAERHLSMSDQIQAAAAANLERGNRLRQAILNMAFHQPDI